MEKPISIGEWLVTYLISIVPIVNIVMLFVWGFGSKTPQTKANWAKASLVFLGIVFAIYFVIGITALAVIN
jgi:hypothetical protein